MWRSCRWDLRYIDSGQGCFSSRDLLSVSSESGAGTPDVVWVGLRAGRKYDRRGIIGRLGRVISWYGWSRWAPRVLTARGSVRLLQAHGRNAAQHAANAWGRTVGRGVHAQRRTTPPLGASNVEHTTWRGHSRSLRAPHDVASLAWGDTSRTWPLTRPRLATLAMSSAAMANGKTATSSRMPLK